jgi:hypothetical protein
MEQVIITRIRISRKGERIFFQVNLPADAEQVTGFDTGAFFKDEVIPMLPANPEPFTLRIGRQRLLGQLSIQATGVAGYCYHNDVVYSDTHNTLGDFWSIQNINDVDVPRYIWPSQVATHGRPRQPDAVLIKNPVILYGSYNDELGLQLDRHFEYRVQLYTWFTLKQEA